MYADNADLAYREAKSYTLRLHQEAATHRLLRSARGSYRLRLATQLYRLAERLEPTVKETVKGGRYGKQLRT